MKNADSRRAGGASLILLLSFLGPASAAAFATDWIVTGPETREGSSVSLDGNLTIESGGQLTLRGVALTVHNAFDGEHGIRVKAGGALTIDQASVITTASTTARMFFVVEKGASLVMRHSELRNCGWAITYKPDGVKSAGPQILADEPVIEDNVFSGNFISLELREGHGGSIRRNTFLDSPATLHHVSLVGREGVTIEGNWFSPNPWWGIFMGNASNFNIVRSNTFDHNMHGALATDRSWNNEFSGNTVNGGEGVYVLRRSSNTVICDNSFDGSPNGITVMQGSDYTTIRDNRFSNVQGWDIVLSYVSHGLVAGNTFSHESAGIEYASLYLYHSSQNVIVNNRIASRAVLEWDGIGILAWGSSTDNLILGNEIASARRGISLHYSADRNTIAYNTVRESVEQPVVVELSRDNQIHHNNFDGFGRHALDDTGLNRWDDAVTGNYWSDDPAAGSAPYAVAPSGVDNHPLAAPIAQQPVPFEPLPAIPLDVPADFDELTVNDAVVIRDQTIGPYAAVTVRAGASLTLDHATLLMIGDEGFIDVETGGALYVYASRIEPPTPETGGFFFRVRAGATFVMKDSVLRGVGGWPSCGDWGATFVLASNSIVENNEITDCMCGFMLTGGHHRIVGNTIARVGAGIFGSSGPSALTSSELADNQIQRSLRFGIQGSAGGNTIRHNIISNVWSIGIMATIDERVESNQISVAGVGIRLASIDDRGGSTVQGNVVRRAYGAAMVAWGPDQTIVGNTFASSGVGLITGEERSVIHGNTFAGNGVQAPAGGVASWDDGQRGNYWSDYQGHDLDGDGIGDTPYVLPDGVTDRFPLMAPTTPGEPRRRGVRH